MSAIYSIIQLLYVIVVKCRHNKGKKKQKIDNKTKNHDNNNGCALCTVQAQNIAILSDKIRMLNVMKPTKWLFMVHVGTETQIICLIVHQIQSKRKKITK